MRNGSSILSVFVVLALLAPSFAASSANVGYNCVVSPSPVSVTAGASAVGLSISCTNDGLAITCPTMSWSTNIGSVASKGTSSASFTPPSSSGTGSVTASGSVESPGAGPVAGTSTPISCSANVVAAAAPVITPKVATCSVSPSSAALDTGATQGFSVSCATADGSQIACPGASWTTTIGTISTGSVAGTTATLNAGATAGTGTVRAAITGGSGGIQAAGVRIPLGSDTTGTGVLTAALVTVPSGGSTLPSTLVYCTASVTVASSQQVPTTLVVAPQSSTLNIGATQQFAAHIYDQNGLEMPNAAGITWTTSAMVVPTPAPAPTPTANALVGGTAQPASASNSCGSVTSTGLFTGRVAGTCNVVAKLSTPNGRAPYISGEALVTVSASTTPVPTSVVVSPASATVYVNGQQPFTATVYDQFGSPMPGQTVTWGVTTVSVPVPAATKATPTASALVTSGAAGTAPATACGTVAPDPTGSRNSAIFTARLAGRCRVVAKTAISPPSPTPAPTPAANALVSGGSTGGSYIEGAADVTILASQAPVPTTITVEPSSATVSLNGQYQFTAHVYDQNGVAMAGQKITWTTSAMISPTPVTKGVATAAALIGLAASNSCGTIAPDPTGSRNSAVFTARLAGTCQVVAKVAVPSTKVASIATASALISAVAGTSGYIEGRATVTVTAANTGTPTSVVVVAAAPSPADSASDKAINFRHRVKRNVKQQFLAYVYDENGNLMQGVPVVWSLVTESIGGGNAPVSQIGTIDRNGIFIGRLAGLGQVKATVFVNAPLPTPAQQLGIPTTASALVSAPSGGASGAISGTLPIEVLAVDTMTCAINSPTIAGLNVRVNTDTQLSASCMQGANEVVCPILNWGSTIGTVEMPSKTVAIFHSGQLAGTGSIETKGIDPATGAGFSCSLPVTVSSGVPTTITVSPASAVVQVGGTQQFSAIVRDEFGNELPNDYAVLWTVETLSIGDAANNRIGAIDQAGLFTASLTGTGYAVATLESPDGTPLVGKAKIQVVAATSGTTICTLDPQGAQLAVNQQQVYSVTCTNVDGTRAQCPEMAWTSTIGKIAIDPVGRKDTAVFVSSATGTGVVTATSLSPSITESITCSAKVAVGSGTPGIPAGVNIVPTSASLSVGQSQKFIAEVYDDAGNLLDPNAQDSWYLQWTADSAIGKVDDTGYFAATAAGDGTVSVEVIGPWLSTTSVAAAPVAIKATAKVSVSATQTGIYCMLSPGELTTPINTKTEFTASCYDPNGPCAGVLGCPVDCPVMDWSATIGSILPSPAIVGPATFDSGSVAGAGTVTAVGQLTTATVATSLISCSAPVTVTGGTINSMQLVPTSASLLIGDTQDFDAYGYDAAGNSIGKVADSQLTWSVEGTVGSVDGSGVFSATTLGSGNVVADYNANTVTQVIQAKAPVSVSSSGGGSSVPPGPGPGAGSSNSGGGSFSTASTLSYTCAAEPGSLAVRILKPGATMLAEIWGSGQKVFSTSSSSDGTFPFTVPKEGDYEVRVSADGNQRSVSFSMPACTPATKEEVKEINIQVKEPETPKVPEKPKAPETPVAPPVQKQEGIPSWALVLGAVLLLAGAYFLIFGKKPKPR